MMMSSSVTPRTEELRLVLLPGCEQGAAGESSAGNHVLLRAFQSRRAADAAAAAAAAGPRAAGLKHRGQAAGRQVVVVDAPDWFSSDCPPEERKRLVSSLVALSSPGPHAFLLCVPLNQPPDGRALWALDALERLLGPAALSAHTLVLFTEEGEGEGEGRPLEEHLTEGRKDLLELVERCGGRYHALRKRRVRGGGEEEEEEEEEQRKAAEALLEKVEQVAREGGGETEYFTCQLYREAEARVRERQVELVRRKRREEEEEQQEEEAGDIDEEEMAKVRDEAERSVGDLNVNVDDITPPPAASLSSPSPPPSLLWGLWQTLVGWLRRLPTLVRREALFGSLVGLFVGGPFGGMLGATVGSVATEVGRRKTQKNK